LDEKRRRELIERILDDIYVNFYSYRDFVLDCVRKVIESWSDEDILRWVGDEDVEGN